MTAAEATKANLPGPRMWPLSVQAYHALGELNLIPEKTELLYGQVYQKMSKFPVHCLLCMRLLEALRRVLPPDVHLRQEQPITCDDSEPEPDLAVIRGSIEEYRDRHPPTAELVVEVCVSSHEYDRSKLRAYAGAGVKEVWFVLGPEKQVEIYRAPAGREYGEHTVHGPGGELSSAVLPEFRIQLDVLFG